MKNNKEIIQTSTEVAVKQKKLKNQALLKRGSFSIAITAIVLAGLIVINWLMGALADRYNLTIDMTTDQKNSISQENIDYIKTVDTDVTVTVCGMTEENFYDYMLYYAQNYYGITISSNAEAEYFTQMPKLLSKYNDYNSHINIKYIDSQDTEYIQLQKTYSDLSILPGDILVTSEVNNKERIKHLSIDDIYVLSTDQSSYYSSTTIKGSRLETSLTSAIAYVTNKNPKKVAMLTGHSKNDYTGAYTELLEINTYDVTPISDTVINKISSEYDVIVISAPTTDFAANELDAISKFLENDGKLGKGLIYFADATCPELPNLNAYLKQWGISVQSGMLFETDDSNHLVNEPSIMAVYPASFAEDDDDDIVAELNPALSGYIVPMKVCESSSSEIKAKALMQSLESTVAVPIDTPKTWKGYSESDMQSYDAVIQSTLTRIDNSIEDISKRELSSYVMAFSSVEFVESVYATDSQYSAFSNQEIILAATERAAHAEGDNLYTFESKVINGESFYSKITEKDTKIVGIIFKAVLPILVAAAGVVIFILRRKSV